MVVGHAHGDTAMALQAKVGAIKAALQLPLDVGIVDARACHAACKQMGVMCQRAATRCQPSPTASWK